MGVPTTADHSRPQPTTGFSQDLIRIPGVHDGHPGVSCNARKDGPGVIIGPGIPLSPQQMATQNAPRNHGSGRTLPEWVAWVHGEDMVDIVVAPPGVEPKPGNVVLCWHPPNLFSDFSGNVNKRLYTIVCETC